MEVSDAHLAGVRREQSHADGTTAPAHRAPDPEQFRVRLPNGWTVFGALARIAVWDRQRLCLMRRWAAGVECHGNYDGEVFNETLQPILERSRPNVWWRSRFKPPKRLMRSYWQCRMTWSRRPWRGRTSRIWIAGRTANTISTRLSGRCRKGARVFLSVFFCLPAPRRTTIPQ